MRAFLFSGFLIAIDIYSVFFQIVYDKKLHPRFRNRKTKDVMTSRVLNLRLW